MSPEIRDNFSESEKIEIQEMNDLSMELILQHVRANFYERLERKTGWGREELKIEFERSMTSALAHFLTLMIDEAKTSLKLLEKGAKP
jgi:hypothetical protein